MTQVFGTMCCAADQSMVSVSLFSKWEKSKTELVQWVLSSAILMASCLSFIFINPFIAVEANSDMKYGLNVTLATTYSNQGMLWIKSTFFSGFAIGQFSLGFLAQRFGNMKVLRWMVKSSIIFGAASTLALNIEVFCILWFLVAFFSTSSYLLMVSPVLETIEMKTNDWKWRLVIGILFQFSWTFGRLMTNLTATLFTTWTTVVLFMVVILGTIYFSLENYVWTKEITESFSKENAERFDWKITERNRVNFAILILLWFTLGYNFYGNLHWTTISKNDSNFAHNIIATIFSLISFTCALFLCFIARGKRLPLIILQILTAICYFVLASVDFKKFRYPFEMGFVLVLHLSTFLIKASFALAWVITPELFPKTNRFVFKRNQLF